jgi:6-phosphogluconolactonase (cycloisomerase 2 family)
MNSTLNCYQPHFTVLNEHQVLVEIAGGTITRLEERVTPKPPTYLAIRHNGQNVYFYDYVSQKVQVYEPVSMALFHQVCDLFCQPNLKNEDLI